MKPILITICLFMLILSIQGCDHQELESGIYEFKRESINAPRGYGDPALIEVWVTNDTFKIYRESGGIILSGHQCKGDISFSFSKESREPPRNTQLIYSGKVESPTFASGTSIGSITNQQSVQEIKGNWSIQKRSEFPPEARIVVNVVDEDGNPVEGANVSVGFEVLSPKPVKGITDSNGRFTAQGPTDPILGKRATKEGFYDTNETQLFKALNEDRTRYEPWGDVRTLVLRKKIDIKEGKTVSVGKFNHRIKENWPLFDQQIGFDYLVGDWVTPHGEGIVADFVVTATYNENNKYHAYSYSINFTGRGNGIFELPITTKNYDSWSDFRWPHKAPLDGYVNVVKKKSNGYGGDSNKLSDFEEIPREQDSKMNHIFRIRTQYDNDGNIRSAYYGKMKGYMRIHPRSGLRFNYWINTDSQSRSLESTYKYRPY